ncbi:hypothetical protein HN51_059662 [Arachis hypogaea]|uniref:Exostosin GT47 domain-containing protein n=1 Tax=Arachis hypogaea TaxID=3818 RepID=A0A444X6L3_ARAHY|nr:probable glycosyltransferase At5g25310 [Arachis ipaensis]XP_016181500.1 probable glycosyltransferase At5g25310 [Arachis ipaensis]XP_025682264.2 probable glycosyltransferase At5g25310 [Arachis hypogaea]XP_029152229.1 probable glycosyltransferase At5g25310 [Arachis hypogaea]QHN83115.1 putative glycosyltransferase [Arachis hypogaea]QHN83116.1 putative glycosyltransferase [Arachis hypogaea]RYQ85335.1 hypothetical protein Ahy_B10g104866 [Arachis hypogaea]
MGQAFFSIFQLETKRLLWLIGITFAVFLLFQYSELPYLATTTTSSGSSRFHPADPPSESILNNVTTDFDIANSTNGHVLERIVDSTSSSIEKDNVLGAGFVVEPKKVSISNTSSLVGFDESDENPVVENVRISDNGSTIKQAENLELKSSNNGMDMNFTREVNTSSELEHKSDTYLSPPVEMKPNITPPQGLLNISNEIDSENDERPKDDVNVLGKNSSISSMPKENKDSRIAVPKVTSISEMNELLLKSRVSYRSMRPRWSSSVDNELLKVRSEIENAPIVENVDNLYAPLYRNLSMFKRSYELMEETLKVYVYREGSKPIMHLPYLLGIYASEGWFMRQMEGNKRFVTKDPKKAHLFYLPFSSRMLEETLYVPDSHNNRNLRKYLNGYVDLIAAKHPFWNRTGGADHFLVACHDWAPTETRQNMAKCIRALCNSDVKEGFVIGKDVSLPETYVRNAQKPTRDIGGRPVSKRKTLAFFAGGMHGYVRPILLQHWENKDPDMKIFGILPKSKGNRNYIQYMKSSKYCICAKGYEVNSPRVVEAIFYECVPVIISDNFVPPFFEVLNWESFAVIVMEKDIPNLKSILLSIPQKRYLQMQMRVKKVQQHFLWHRSPEKYDMFHMILHSIWFNRVFTTRAR